jgi:hypothetical protein
LDLFSFQMSSLLVVLLSLAVLAMAFAEPNLPNLPDSMKDETLASCEALQAFAIACSEKLFDGEGFVPSANDGPNLCACVKEFDAWDGCLSEVHGKLYIYGYKAYLGNNCAWPEASTWFTYDDSNPEPRFPNAPQVVSDDLLKTLYPPAIQNCASSHADSIGLTDFFTVYDVCAPNDGAGVLGKWQEKWWINVMQQAGRPKCFTDSSCVESISGGYSADDAFCPVLEECQGHGSCSDDDFYYLQFRRSQCKCPYGEVKTPSGRRCDPIERNVAEVEVSQSFLTSVAAENFKQSAGSGSDMMAAFKTFIGQTVFPDEDIDNSKTYVDIDAVVDIDSNGNVVVPVRRALLARKLIQTAVGIRISYTVSVPVSSSNPSQGVAAISTVSNAISTQSFTNSLAIAMSTSMGSAPSAIAPVPPTIVSVITASTSAPTAAPTAAPTVRAKYTSSPIIIFSCFGGIGVLAFVFYCYHHHNPKVESGAASQYSAVSKPTGAGDVALVNRA